MELVNHAPLTRRRMREDGPDHLRTAAIRPNKHISCLATVARGICPGVDRLPLQLEQLLSPDQVSAGSVACRHLLKSDSD